MQRIIGLDIGSYSVKAVEIVNTFKSYEIANFYENVIPHSDELDPDQVIPNCMEQLFVENNIQADRIVTAMPGQYISSRIMAFNFSEARKIQTAVLAEVEDAVPFHMDDMIVDHQIIGTIDGKTMALVAMTRKNFLRSFLEHLQRIDIDPKLVDIDSLSFYNLSSYLDMPPGECCAIVDVGHEKTSVCIVQDQVLRMFRSINLGGRYLTEFLSRDHETSFVEAQRLKHQVSRVLCEADAGEDLANDEKLVAERLTLACNSIVKELGRTFYAFKTWEKAPISRIYLSGGTAKIKNFDLYLQDQLEVEVQQNRIFETSLQINPDLEPHMSIMPQSIAIGLRAVGMVKRHSQINLRQGEFAYVQNYESVLKAAGIIFRVVAVVLLLLCFSYGVKFFFYKRQIDTIQDQFLKEYAQVFPAAAKQYQRGTVAFERIRSDARSKLQREIETRRVAVSRFIEENDASAALVVLKGVSQAIPKEHKIDVTLFQYKTLPVSNESQFKGKVTIRGQTDGYSTLAAIIESIKKANILSNVTEKNSGSLPGSDNKIIQFTIEADYAGSPDSNANAS